MGRNWLLLLHYGAENLTGWVKIVNYHYIMGPRQNKEVLNRLSFSFHYGAKDGTWGVKVGHYFQTMLPRIGQAGSK